MMWKRRKDREEDKERKRACWEKQEIDGERMEWKEREDNGSSDDSKPNNAPNKD